MMLTADRTGKVPLFTSLPPALVRPDKSGRDIGPEYQLACIRSWIDAGFRPISVNGPDEQPPHQDLVEVMRTTRTAKELHGKPVVFIDDLFAIANQVTPGPVMIINADILLRPGFDLASLVANLPADRALIARRIDIEIPESAEGEAFIGFDVFAASAARLTEIPNSDFAFGLPWWDSYVPAQLHMSGLESAAGTPHFAYHLKHADRYDWDSWIKLGIGYAERFSNTKSGDKWICEHSDISKHVLRQAHAMRPWQSTIALAKAVNAKAGDRVENFLNRRLRKSLRRLAHHSSRMIGETFACERTNQRPKSPG